MVSAVRRVTFSHLALQPEERTIGFQENNKPPCRNKRTPRWQTIRQRRHFPSRSVDRKMRSCAAMSRRQLKADPTERHRHYRKRAKTARGFPDAQSRPADRAVRQDLAGETPASCRDCEIRWPPHRPAARDGRQELRRSDHWLRQPARP